MTKIRFNQTVYLDLCVTFVHLINDECMCVWCQMRCVDDDDEDDGDDYEFSKKLTVDKSRAK